MILPRKKLAGIAAAIFGAVALMTACERVTPLPVTPPSPPPAMTTARDEVYLFPHGRLSMSAYENLRWAYPNVAPYDLTQIAMASQWLLTRVSSGKTATLLETTQCVRAAFLPKVKKADLKKATKTASEKFGFASLESLRKSFDDALPGWKIDWNPNLVTEYGITLPKR